MNRETFGGIVGTSVSAVGTTMQTNELLQTISLILTIIGTLITIAMAITSWWKNAKKDGKITSKEVKDGIDIVTEGVKAIGDKLKDKEENNGFQSKD